MYLHKATVGFFPSQTSLNEGSNFCLVLNPRQRTFFLPDCVRVSGGGGGGGSVSSWKISCRHFRLQEKRPTGRVVFLALGSPGSFIEDRGVLLSRCRDLHVQILESQRDHFNRTCMLFLVLKADQDYFALRVVATQREAVLCRAGL